MLAKTLRIGVAAAVLAAVGFASTASAAPSEASETHFFSDATYTTQVGTRWINCYPPYIVTEGEVTVYRVVVFREPCY